MSLSQQEILQLSEGFADKLRGVAAAAGKVASAVAPELANPIKDVYNFGKGVRDAFRGQDPVKVLKDYIRENEYRTIKFIKPINKRLSHNAVIVEFEGQRYDQNRRKFLPSDTYVGEVFRMRDKSYRVGRLSDKNGNQIGGNKPGVSAPDAVKEEMDEILQGFKSTGETQISPDVVDVSFQGQLYDAAQDQFEQQLDYFVARVRAIHGENSVQYVKRKSNGDIIDVDVLKTERQRNQFTNQHMPALRVRP